MTRLRELHQMKHKNERLICGSSSWCCFYVTSNLHCFKAATAISGWNEGASFSFRSPVSGM